MFKEHLSRDIAIVLVIKLAALCAIYFGFFAASARPPIDPAAHIAGFHIASHPSSAR